MTHVTNFRNFELIALFSLLLETESTHSNCSKQTFLTLATVYSPMKLNFRYIEDHFVKKSKDRFLHQILTDNLERYYQNKRIIKPDVEQGQRFHEDNRQRLFKVPKKLLTMSIRRSLDRSEAYYLRHPIYLHIPMKYLKLFKTLKDLLASYFDAQCLVYDETKICVAGLGDFAEIGFIVGSSCDGSVPGYLIESGVIVDLYKDDRSENRAQKLHFWCLISVTWIILYNI